MTIRNLEHLLSPQSVVLVGASERPGRVGTWLARNLAVGFSGPLLLVNPGRDTIEGQPCFRTIADLPIAPALGVVATPPEEVPATIAALGARGTRAAVVVTAGIRGPLRQAMLDAARPYTLRIQGPNCLGLMVPGLGLNASFSHIPAPAGDLAFLSQSGALVTGVLDWAASRRIGFSHVVSLGDMADVDFGDLLDYLAGDTKSRAILMYVEALTSAAKFMSAARRAARSKPVIVVKAGRNAAGAKAAASHTGALSGADAAYDAAFRRAGVLRVGDLEDLFNAAEMLARVPRLDGDRLAILTNGGGAGVLAADRIADLDGRLAALAPATLAALDQVLPATWSHGNPVDIIGDADDARYRKALAVLLEDPGTDAILAINCPVALASSQASAEAVIAARAATLPRVGAAKPILTCWLGEGAAQASRELFAASGLASFSTPDAAITGFMQVVRHARAQDLLMRTPPPLGPEARMDRDTAAGVIAAALAAGREMLTEVEGKALLAAYGVPTVETIVTGDAEAAEAAAARLLETHAAVAIKILSDDITHKSDIGGVRLDLETPAAVAGACREMLTRIAAARPDARIQGVTVQPMIRRPQAHELIVGVSEDATFGPVVLFGAGGVGVEVIGDTSLALPPLDLVLARDLMARTRIWRLLKGYRDRPPADLDAIARVLLAVGQLVSDHPEIRELDINPLLADHHGVVALDARVRVVDAVRQPRTPMALRPYPTRWESPWSHPELGDILLRPIRPEDEHLYEAFFRHVSLEDSRMRFFTPLKGLSHRFIARLTQIDYAREMAFIAIRVATGEMLGVARLAADPDYVTAEYGVMVRTDLKGVGLGWRLMQHLIAYARAEGLTQLFGNVLAENTTMLAMCAELGFEDRAVVGDATLREVVLDLQAG